jgi:6-phosphogluconate dehydrogenase
MSTINGLTGPRLPTPTASSAAGGAPRTSFLSRVQASTSGGVAIRPANAPLVSGRDIVSQTVSAARQEAAAGSTQDAGAPPMSDQEKAIHAMSRAVLMGTIQSIFQGFGQMPTVERD